MDSIAKRYTTALIIEIMYRERKFYIQQVELTLDVPDADVARLSREKDVLTRVGINVMTACVANVVRFMINQVIKLEPSQTFEGYAPRIGELINLIFATHHLGPDQNYGFRYCVAVHPTQEQDPQYHHLLDDERTFKIKVESDIFGGIEDDDSFYADQTRINFASINLPDKKLLFNNGSYTQTGLELIFIATAIAFYQHAKNYEKELPPWEHKLFLFSLLSQLHRELDLSSDIKSIKWNT